MTNPQEVVLDVATAADATLLSNLLELYIHDLSPAFPAIEVGADGRFGYDKLPLYWSEPERRFAFLIRYGARVAGFVLVTRGSPVSDDFNVFDVAEFFVMRRFRRSGLGRQAIGLLWDRFPGKWIVRVSETNANGLPFWRRVIAEYTRGTAAEVTRAGTPNAWRVFSFNNSQRTREQEEQSVRQARAHSSTDIHAALFPQGASPQSLTDLKLGLRQAVVKRHDRSEREDD